MADHNRDTIHPNNRHTIHSIHINQHTTQPINQQGAKFYSISIGHALNILPPCLKSCAIQNLHQNGLMPKGFFPMSSYIYSKHTVSETDMSPQGLCPEKIAFS